MSDDVSKWSTITIEPNHKLLGKRLGKDRNKVVAALAALTPKDVETYQETGHLNVVGFDLSGEELILKKEFKGDASIYQAETSPDGSLLVILDTRQDDRVLAQATVRELVNRIQKLRKKAGLKLTDVIEIFFETSDPSILQALSSNMDMVRSTLRIPPLPAKYKPTHAVDLGSESSMINETEVTVSVTRPTISFATEVLEAELKGDAEMVQGVQSFVASMDYDRIKSSNGNNGNGGQHQLSLILNDQSITLVQGKHYFLTALERIQALKSAEFAWLN